MLYFSRHQTAPVTRPPFGYTWDKNGKQHVVDREAEPQVRAIFATFDSGNFSLSQLCDYLNERDMRPRSGIDWSPANLRAFLVQPFYCGRFRHRGEIHDGTHEPYFSVAEYERRVERLSKRRSGLPNRKNSHPLDCLIRCPECGRHFIKEFNHRPKRGMHYLYYKHQCPGEKTTTRFREADVWNMIDDRIESARFSSAFAENLKALFEKPLSNKRRRNRKEKESIAARITKLERQKERLLDLFTLEEISQSDLLERRRVYESQLALLKQSRDALDQDADLVFEKIASAVDLLRRLPDSYSAAADPAEKIKILRQMADGLTLEGPNSVRMNWKKPYDLLMERPEIVEAISVDRIGGPSGNLSDTVYSRLRQYTKDGNSLSAVEQIIVDFKFWLAGQ